MELFIRCPATGKPVPTGIVLPTPDWNRTARFWAYTTCTACGADHEWQAADVWPRTAELGHAA